MYKREFFFRSRHTTLTLFLVLYIPAVLMHFALKYGTWMIKNPEPLIIFSPRYGNLRWAITGRREQKG